MSSVVALTETGATATLYLSSSRSSGKERDSETGLDYFGARYYGSNMGRFLSPDEFTGGPVNVFGGSATPPAPLPYADLSYPQSLNKYAYGYGNPVVMIDPDGHLPKWLEGLVNSFVEWKKGPAPSPVPFNIPPPKANRAATSKQGMVITYSQSTGRTQQLDPAGNKKDLGTGYSGHGGGVNNPESQSVGTDDDKENAGPLPRGEYTIGKQQDIITATGTLLPASMRLSPSSDNRMFERGGFIIHGDNKLRNQTASEGCPVLDRPYRNAIAQTGITTLVVER